MVFQHVSAARSSVVVFDPSGHKVACACQAGKVVIFDVASSAILSTLHLKDSGVVAALCWCGPLGGAAGRHAQLLAALDDANTVTVFDVNSEARIWSHKCNEGLAIALALDGLNDRLVCASTNGTLATFAAATGDKRVVPTAVNDVTECVCIPGTAEAVVAGGKMAITDLETGKTNLRLSGHSNPITALAVAPDGAYIVSSAATERAVAVFCVDGGSQKKSRALLAACTLPCAHPAVGLACTACEWDGAAAPTFRVVAISDHGAASVWKCAAAGAGTTPAATASKLCEVVLSSSRGPAAGKPGLEGVILAATFQSRDALAFAYGHSVRPALHVVRVPGEASPPAEVELPAGTRQLLVSGSEAPSAQPAQHAAMVGDASTTVPQHRKRTSPDADTSPGLASDPTFGEPLAVGVSLRERVAALTGSALPAGPTPAPHREAAGGGPLTADSLTTLLLQAIHADDEALLDTALAVGSRRVARNSVARLPSSDAARLLTALTTRLQRTPARAAMLLPWLRACVLCHGRVLAVAAAADSSLPALFKLAEARAVLLQPVLSLLGRLELLASMAAPTAAQLGGRGALAGPELVYDVGPGRLEAREAGAGESGAEEEEDYEVEEPFAMSASSSAEEDGSATSDDGAGGMALD